jgi:hypothetical protein
MFTCALPLMLDKRTQVLDIQPKVKGIQETMP